MKEEEIKLLEFIYDRMINLCNEGENVDYMRGLKGIISKCKNAEVFEIGDQSRNKKTPCYVYDNVSDFNFTEKAIK